MTKFYKLSKWLALASCTLAIFSATQVWAAPEGVKLASVQEVRQNNNDYPTSLDPNKGISGIEWSLANSMFETLVRKNGYREFVPAAAQSWTVSDDGLTWTFELRKEAKWSDGKPVTAHDFVYSWRRLLDPKTGAFYGEYLKSMNVLNADKVIDGKAKPEDIGVRAVDDYHLEVKLSQPTPWLVNMVAVPILAPLREDVITKWGDQWTTKEHMVNNGAYKLEEAVFKDHLVLVRNTNYWNDKDSTITKATWTFVNNPNAAYYGFESGAYTVAEVPNNLIDKAKQQFGDAVVSSRHPFVRWLAVNVKTVPDVRARKALALLFDYNTYAGKLDKLAVATTKPLPQDFNEGELIQEQDWLKIPRDQRVKQALELLQEAGYSKEKPLVLDFLLTKEVGSKLAVAALDWLQKDSQGLVVLNKRELERKAWVSDLFAKKFDLAYGGWGADYDQVTTYLDLFRCGNPLNYTNWCNADYDKLLNQASLQKTKEERQKLYAQAAKLVMDDYAWNTMYQEFKLLLKDPRLLGYDASEAARSVQDWYIADESDLEKAKEYEKSRLAKK